MDSTSRLGVEGLRVQISCELAVSGKNLGNALGGHPIYPVSVTIRDNGDSNPYYIPVEPL